MSETRPETDATENHAWLLREFVAFLCGFGPQRVLDVGCGGGLLLEELRARGVAVLGLDQPGPRLAALIEAGLDAREGSAYELPFEGGAVDWVTLRHVPHHLEDPPRAFAEALRVAGRGVLIAEPWFDATLPSHRGALALDRWEKRQHRRRGMYHGEVLHLGDLVALMPPGFEQDFTLQACVHLRLRRRSVEDFARGAAELVDDLPRDHPERANLTALLEELGRTGLSWNGSLCLALVRR